MRRAGVTALVLGLLLATAAAFGHTERLKLERSPVTAPRLERLIGPTCECPRETADLAVTLRRGDRLDASIVDMDGEHVRTLARGLRRPQGRTSFRWDGRDDGGRVVPDGRYRLRLDLDEENRTIVVPTPIRVDATPPRIRLISAKPRVISPDGDGRGDRVQFAYRTNEPAYPVVFVDGAHTVRGQHRPAGVGRVRWRGRVGGEFAEPGTYTTWLEAVDPAGNRSEPTVEVPIRVRFVELTLRELRARRGGLLRFGIDADASHVRWTLTRAGAGAGAPILSGRAEPGPQVVRLPQRVRPGRYVLEVEAVGHSDRGRLDVIPR